jgi:hypothetical protein
MPEPGNNQERKKQAMGRNKLKGEFKNEQHNIPKIMGYSKNCSKREIYSNMCPHQKEDLK